MTTDAVSRDRSDRFPDEYGSVRDDRTHNPGGNLEEMTSRTLTVRERESAGESERVLARFHLALQIVAALRATGLDIPPTIQTEYDASLAAVGAQQA